MTTNAESLRGDAWSAEGERTSSLPLRFMKLVYRALGRRVCVAVLYPVAAFFVLVDAKSRRASRQFLNQVATFTEAQNTPTLLTTFFHIHEFARALVDKFAVWQNDIPFESVIFEERNSLRERILGGDGAIVFGGHVGNMEVSRSLTEDVPGIRVNALMYLEHNPHFNRLIADSNPSSQLRIIRTEAPTPALIAELRACIERGEIVSMLADRVMPGSPEKVVPCSFLGKKAHLPAGPLILASLLEAPVYTLFCFREGERYRMYIEKLCDPIRLRRGHRSEDLEHYAQLFADRLEQFAVRYPLQWYNFFDYWGSVATEGSDTRV